MTRLFGAACAALLLGSTALPAAAQHGAAAGPEFHGLMGVQSAYVWRGLSITNRAILQPEVALTGPLLGFGWNASVEGIVEQSDPADNALALGGLHGGVDLAEVDLLLEAARRFGPFSATLGVTSFLYPNGWGIGPEENTTELFARVGWTGPVVLTAAWYHDIGVVNGAYAEAGLEVPLRGLSIPCAVGLVAGMNLGQGPAESHGETGAHEVAYFAGRGLTHLDLSATASFTLGALQVTPVGHLVYGADALTRITGEHTMADFKAWFGVTLGWATPIGTRPATHLVADTEHDDHAGTPEHGAPVAAD